MSDTTKIKGGIQLEAVDIGTISNPKNNSIVLDSNDNKLKKYNESLDLWEEIASGVVCSGPTPVVFNIANDQSTEANITGLIIDVNEATTFDLEYVIRRSTDDNSVSQKGVFSGVYDLNDSVWYKSDTFAGLNAGVDFFIDNSTGQISYTSTEITGANYTGSISYVLKTNKSCSINIDGDVTGALGQTKVEAIQNVPVPAPTAGDDGKVLVYNDISGEFEYDDIFDGAVVINESGADVDFRVESDTNVNALFVKGSSGNVGIGTASPGSRLDVVGATAYDSAATFRSNTAANNWARIDIKNHNVATPAILYQDQAGTFTIRTDAAYPITFATNGANERMRIGSSGNVGIGTSSPDHGLVIQKEGDVAGFAASINSKFFSNIDRAWYRLSRARGTISSPLNVQSGDTLGSILFEGYGGSDFRLTADIAVTANENFSSTTFGSNMIFRTSPNGNAGRTERMRINSDGNVLVGNSSFGVNDGILRVWGLQGVRANSLFQYNGTGSHTFVNFSNNSNSNVGQISTNGTNTTYGTGPSDYRLKENITELSGGLDAVHRMRPVSFTWKHNGERSVGFIAHELQEVIPDSVIGEKDAVDANSNPIYQSLFPAPAEMIANLVSAIQELKAELDTVKAELDQLKGL